MQDKQKPVDYYAEFLSSIGQAEPQTEAASLSQPDADYAEFLASTGQLNPQANNPDPDGPAAYSFDVMQRMMGRGTQSVGELIGSDTVADWGKDYVSKQDEEIAAGGYRPEYQGSFTEQDGIGKKLGWVGEKVQENLASGTVGLGGTALALASAPFSAPLAAAFGGATLASTGLMGAGEVAQEFEDKGLESNPLLEVLGGGAIGALERFGAGKVLSPKVLTKLMGDELMVKLMKDGKKEAAKAYAKEILKRTGYEVGTEELQEGTSVGLAGASGAQYTPDELIDRAIDTAIVTTPYGATFSTPNAVAGVRKTMASEQKRAEDYYMVDPETGEVTPKNRSTPPNAAPTAPPPPPAANGGYVDEQTGEVISKPNPADLAEAMAQAAGVKASSFQQPPVQGDFVQQDVTPTVDQKYDLNYNLPKNTVVGGAIEIGNLVERAKINTVNDKVRFAVVDNDTAQKLKESVGLDLDGYKHTVDGSGIRHALKQHSDSNTEEKRGQLAISREDFERIPEIVSNPDEVVMAGKDAKGLDIIRYKKRFNGVTYYAEEIRNKRQELALKSLWKTPTREQMPNPEESSPLSRSERLGGNSPELDQNIAEKSTNVPDTNKLPVDTKLVEQKSKPSQETTYEAQKQTESAKSDTQAISKTTPESDISAPIKSETKKPLTREGATTLPLQEESPDALNSVDGSDVEDSRPSQEQNQEKATKNPDSKFSKPEPDVDTGVTELWQQLAMAEEIFQQPKSRAKGVREIAADIDAGIQVEQLDVPMHKQANTVTEWKLTMPDGKPAYLRENQDATIELNAALLVSGQSRGSALYNIAATYAHNNGKVFIGDRDGLSDEAFYRRTENMMSSALKFGTTKHLRPHPKQGIDWVPGDDKGNLTRLIQKHYANITEYFPAIKSVEYDFAEKAFINTTDGQRFTEDDFRATAGVTRGKGTPQAGARTLKRAALTNTLVQGAGKETRLQILGQLVRQLRTQLDPALGEILYSKASPTPKSPAKAGLSVSEVEKTIAPVILKWGNSAPTVEVVQSVDDIPPDIVDTDDHPKGFEAVYYSPSGQVYLVADRLSTPERALKVLAHEAVGHHSFEDLMGDDLDTVLERVLWLKRDDKKIADIAKEVRRRYSAREPQTGRMAFTLSKSEEAREIVAVMAERGIKHPLLARVVAAIRKFLRKLGISLKWTATELEALVVQAGKRLEKHESGKKKSDKNSLYNQSKMFSRPEKEIRDNIEKAVLSVSKEDTKAWLKQKADETWSKTGRKTIDTTRPGWLKGLTLLHLVDVGSDVLPQIKQYYQTFKDMEADRSQMLADMSEKIITPWEKWARKNEAENLKLANLMNDATIAGADPAEAYQELVSDSEFAEKRKDLEQKARDMPGEAYKYINQINEMKTLRQQESNRKKAYPELRRRWEAMPQEAKNIYVAVRDYYAQQLNETEKALSARIDRADVSQAEKRAMKDDIRLRFEGMRVQAPYFNLFRAGDYWASITRKGDWKKQYQIRKNGDEWGVFKHGSNKHPTRTPVASFKDKVNAVAYAQEQVQETDFYMFEDTYQHKVFAAQKRKQGYSVKTGVKMENIKAVQGASQGFVSDVIGILDKVPGGQSEQIKDAVYQLYLTTLPDASMRKHSIHRNKTLGYSNDALRGFTYNGFHGAYQLAKLKYTDIMEEQISNMAETVKNYDTVDTKTDREAEKAAHILASLKQRHEWIMNPQSSGWANWITNGAFVWFLGLTPAAAIVNLFQTPVIALPVMASRYGWGNASRELMQAGKDFFSGRVSVKDGVFSASKSSRLSADEKKAFQKWLLSGILDKTLTHDLAGRSERPSEFYGGKKEKAMEIISYGFHHTERFNREVTALAAYRLARKKGLSHEAAIEEGAWVVNKAHYDYSTGNKAPFMHNDFAKVMLIFRQFSLNTTYLLVRNVHQMAKGESKEVRAEARKQLTGILAMQSLAAGLYGLPLWWLVSSILEAAFDDEDDPWDTEVELRNWLADFAGDKVAEVITMGPLQAGSGLGTQGRLSMNNLWFRPPYRDLEMQRSVEYWMLQGIGPFGSILTSAGRGVDLLGEGKIWRGIEAMTPKVIKDGMKAIRYADEGVLNQRGDPVVEELNAWELGMQAVGFSSARVNKQYDVNSAIKGYESRIGKRRQHLVTKAVSARMVGDTDGYKDVLPDIVKFGKKNPRNKIDMDTLRRSANTRKRYSREAKNGIVVRKKMSHLRDRVRFGDD